MSQLGQLQQDARQAGPFAQLGPRHPYYIIFAGDAGRVPVMPEPGYVCKAAAKAPYRWIQAAPVIDVHRLADEQRLALAVLISDRTGYQVHRVLDQFNKCGPVLLP